MRIAYFKDQCAKNAGPVIDAFLSSCQDRGHEIVANGMDCDAAVIWSMLWSGRMAKNRAVYKHYRSQSRPVFVLEVGALARDYLWRVGLNHVNACANFGPRNNDDRRVLDLGLSLDPWCDAGDSILIALQRPDSGQWRSTSEAESWLKSVIAILRSHTNRPIRIRPHPRYPLKSIWSNVKIDTPKRLLDTYDDYDFRDSLNDVWAVVNWSSNPGIVSAMSGIPVFTGPNSLAAAVGLQDLAQIERPIRPDRRQWLNDLVYCEWTVEEIAAGLPLDRLMPTIPHHAFV